MIDFDLIFRALPRLLSGAWLSVKISFFSLILGFVLGIFLALIRDNASGFLKRILGFYVWVLRGTPMLLQIMFFYYVLPLLGLHFSSYITAIIAIGLNSSAYISEIIRSGISAVGFGQKEAAYALGLSRIQTARYIILPQALRVVLPALGNEAITLIKDSSLASLIGVMELLKVGQSYVNNTLDVVSIFFAVGLIYLFLTSIVSAFMNFFEAKLGWYVKN